MSDIFHFQKVYDHGKKCDNCAAVTDLSISNEISLSRHIFNHIQPINHITGHLELTYENKSSSLIESKNIPKFRIAYPNKDHLCSIIKDLKFYVIEKLEDLNLQTVDYKTNLEKPCFNCSSSFHGSSFEDGQFNFQKIFTIRERCIICQINFTTERSFHHNCNICDASFKNCQMLVNHRKRVHNSKMPNQCAACHISLSDHALKRHILRHIRPYLCLHCNKRYAEKSHLKSHISNVCRPITAKEFKCNICPMQFHDKSILKEHQELHAKRFECNSCSRYFSSLHTLQRHSHIHTGDWKHNCCFCNKGFHSWVLLASHMLSHTGENSFSCNYCSKQFKKRKTLLNHLFQHTGGKQFECDLCEKGFAKQYFLNRHAPTHNKLLLQCKYCPKQYKTKKSLNIHLCEHMGGKKFECDICGKKFTTTSLLNQHKFVHMGELFQCTICLKFLKTPSGLNRHKKLHSLM